MGTKMLLNDRNHLAIYDAMCQRLEDEGPIWMADIVKELGLPNFTLPTIRWDLLIKAIQRKHDVKLIPLSKEASNHNLREKILDRKFVIAEPNKHLTHGSGGRKIIAGWISAGNVKAEPVIRQRVKLGRNIAKGILRSAADIEFRLNRALAVTHNSHCQIE